MWIDVSSAATSQCADEQCGAWIWNSDPGAPLSGREPELGVDFTTFPEMQGQSYGFANYEYEGIFYVN